MTAIISLSVSTPFEYDFEASPIKKWGILLHPLSLAQHANSKLRSQKAELSPLVCPRYIREPSQHQQS